MSSAELVGLRSDEARVITEKSTDLSFTVTVRPRSRCSSSSSATAFDSSRHLACKSTGCESSENVLYNHKLE